VILEMIEQPSVGEASIRISNMTVLSN